MIKWLAVAALIFVLGCAYVGVSTPVHTIQVTNKSPWSETIGENYQLTDCQQTARRMQFAMRVHDILIKSMHDKITDPDQQQVMIVEIRALYGYVDDLHTWMSDNCSAA